MTINIDALISTSAGVIKPSGDGLQFNGLLITENTQLPVAQFLTLNTLLQVQDYFGSSSSEAAIAAVYFNSFDNSTKIPNALNFYHHANAARGAFLRGGDMSAVTLTQLKAMTGTLTITVDAETHTTASIVLTTATSFSNAATLITAAIATAFTVDPVCTYDSISGGFEISSITTGASSIITEASGTIAALLKLTVATGAVLSQGIAIQTPSQTMDAVVLNHRNWVTFFTAFEPDLATKELFAAWTNNKNSDYIYVAWDTDTTQLNAAVATDLGSVLKGLNSDGTAVVYGSVNYAALISGGLAGVDTTRPNGWKDMAYKSQAGLAATITTDIDAATLEAKGINFYGDWASRTQDKNFLMHGMITGDWRWIDDFAGQIYLRSKFQESALSLLTQISRLPYNKANYAKLKTVWTGDVIAPAIEIGVIAAGINLDSTQRVLIDNLTGTSGSGDTVATNGWFMSVEDPSAAVRAGRGTPVIIFVYTSGQSIHRLHIPVFNAQ
jgi:hypothetical protein